MVKIHQTKNTVQGLWPTRYGGCETNAKYTPQNRPHLAKADKKGYTDFAVRSNPLCRWCVHLRRRVEVAASIRCRIFYFYRYYIIRTNVLQSFFLFFSHCLYNKKTDPSNLKMERSVFIFDIIGQLFIRIVSGDRIFYDYSCASTLSIMASI